MAGSLTIADVARAAGVSPSAVSFALNGRRGVAPATRDRILATAERLGWRPSASARSLSRSRADAVGLVIARPVELLVADPFFPALIAGAESELATHGQALLLSVVDPGPAETAHYRQLASRGRVDGVLLTDLLTRDDRPDLLTGLGIPAVAVGRPVGGCSVPSVVVDDRPGVAAAVDHLAALGHRRIAYVAGPPPYVHSRSRRLAFTAAARRHGLDDARVVVADFSAAGGAAATAELLDSPHPPTAVLYVNDTSALAGMSTARARGLSVPGDLSVVGFDDTELGRAVQPALTTIAGDPVGWGRTATAVLLDAVAANRDESGAPPATTVLPAADLVVRDSTAPPATRRRRR